MLALAEPEMDIRELRKSIATNPTVDLGVRNWIEDRLKRAKRYGTPHMEIVTLTPQLARELLTQNPDNRSLRQAKMMQLVADIKSSRFMLNGESMIIASNGNLNDGQHRCAAVVQADIPIQTVMVFGVAPETRRTLDNGAQRSPGDHLQFEGVKYASIVAATTRWVLCYERHNRQSVARSSEISPVDIFDRALIDLEIQRSGAVPYQHGQTKRRVALPSVLAFCHYVFAKKHRLEADAFIEDIMRGVSLPATDAAYIVRERLAAMNRPTRETTVEALFHAWNHRRSGDKGSLRGTTGGKLPAIK